MQQSTPSAKKSNKSFTSGWVDYSSDGTSSLISSDATISLNPELQRLRSISPTEKMVWLEVDCSQANHQQKQIIKRLRNDKLKISVFPSREIDGFDIKVFRAEAENYLKSKIPGTNNVIVKFSERNLRREGSKDHQARNYENTPKKSTNAENQRKFSRNKNQNYVDKATGEKPDNRKKFDERVQQENQRRYTKRQTDQIGHQLANFRSKQKNSNSKGKNQNAASPFLKNGQFRWNNGGSSRPKQKQVQKWKMRNPFQEMVETSSNENTPEQAPFVQKLSPTILTSLKEQEGKKSISKNQIISQRSTQTQNSQTILKRQLSPQPNPKRRTRTKSKYKAKH